MATTESECGAVDRCLLDAVKSNQDPSSFENSCTGLQRFDSPKNNGECAVTSSFGQTKWRDFTLATVLFDDRRRYTKR